MSNNTQVITRFAPSPTGAAHAGSYRSAMFAWLYARHTGGKFVLRIEDTDTARNQDGSDTQILESLAWLGINYDELYYQSKAIERHQEIINELIAKGSAYVSTEPAKDGNGMKDVIRFRNPNKSVTVHDMIRGDVTVDTTDLGDFVIARTINEPVFHLANVIDDHDEGVTYVIRAEEHLANTPRQILIFEALGWEVPHYAHLPLVLGPDKLKLSKRRGALSMLTYRDKGYLPEAVLNCVALVGWNPGTEQEIFSREELIALFDLDRVQKGGAMFSEEKLNWFNREHIKRLSPEKIREYVLQYLPDRIKNFETYSEEKLTALIPILLERIATFGEVTALSEAGELDFFFVTPTIDTALLSFKGIELSETKVHLQQVQNILEGISEESWTLDEIKEQVMKYADSLPKRGPALHPLRFSLSGREKSPDPFTISAFIGKTETLARISTTLSRI